MAARCRIIGLAAFSFLQDGQRNRSRSIGVLSRECLASLARVRRHLKIITGFLNVKLKIFSYPPVLTCVLGAQKNRLICFGGEIRRIDIRYAQVTHSRTGRRISHGYNPASFVAIRIGPVAFRIASVIIRSST